MIYNFRCVLHTHTHTQAYTYLGVCEYIWGCSKYPFTWLANRNQPNPVCFGEGRLKNLSSGTGSDRHSVLKSWQTNRTWPDPSWHVYIFLVFNSSSNPWAVATPHPSPSCCTSQRKALLNFVSPSQPLPPHHSPPPFPWPLSGYFLTIPTVQTCTQQFLSFLTFSL